VYEPKKKVAYCYIDNIDKPYDMWMDVVTETPGMEGIKAKINRDMSLSALVKVTADHLAANNLSLFLHLDEFVPFDEAGPVDVPEENTIKNFYSCWKRMLMPILKTPSIFLFISGRLPYFDSVGSGYGPSPCLVASAQLDLFSADIIHEALCKISVPSVPGVDGLPPSVTAQSASATTTANTTDTTSTTTLSEALDALLPMSTLAPVRRGVGAGPDALRARTPYECAEHRRPCE
jgi:hypothetical protein